MRSDTDVERTGDLPEGIPLVTRASVLAKARALVTQARNAFPAWNPPPFDPQIYAALLGIPIAECRGMDCDALLVPASPGFRILCNAAVRSTGRRRFSIAHELVHTLFPDSAGVYHLRNVTPQQNLFADSQQLERLCEEGAAELLMPEECFRAHLEELGLRASAVQILADRFQVSLEATALRITETSETPCAVALLDYQVRPSTQRCADQEELLAEPRRYRVRCAYRSSGFPFLFPRGKSVPWTSVIYQAAVAREDREARETFALGKQASELTVSASALARAGSGVIPPSVCAVFRM